MVNYEIKTNVLTFKEVRGEGTDAVVLDLGKVRINPQITSGGLYLIADDSVVAPVAGDDVTIQGSIDGVHYFAIGESNADIVYGLDDNGLTAVSGKVRYLQFTAAQVQATEYYKFHVLYEQH